jgi:hypothetical protein
MSVFYTKDKQCLSMRRRRPCFQTQAQNIQLNILEDVIIRAVKICGILLLQLDSFFLTDFNIEAFKFIVEFEKDVCLVVD